MPCTRSRARSKRRSSISSRGLTADSIKAPGATRSCNGGRVEAAFSGQGGAASAAGQRAGANSSPRSSSTPARSRSTGCRAMNREFLEFYNQRARDPARAGGANSREEYPGVAERLGGLVGDRADPMIGGLLEGAAFLAARVQLKLKHEFAEFTTNLIDQLVPHYLAPTPSFVARSSASRNSATRRCAKAGPSPRGVHFDATYREARSATSRAGSRWPRRSRSGRSRSSRRNISRAPGPLQALVPNAGAELRRGPAAAS